MMTGRPDGVQMMDLSVDGFWNSFFAIILSVPPLFVGWSGFATDIAAGPGFSQSRLTLLPRLAMVDLSMWVLPLLVLGLMARRIGIADRYAGYVIATNWGSVIFAWIALPPLLIQQLLPMSEEVGGLLSQLVFILTMVLSWRLTNVAIGRGAAMGSAIFAGIFAVSIALMFALYGLLGISVPS